MKLRKKIILSSALLPFFIIGIYCFIPANKALGARTSTVDDSSFLEVVSESPDYVIGAEDVLEVSVWKNSDLSKVVIVRPDGKISLPLIGDVKANGLTPNVLQNDISEKLKKYQEELNHLDTKAALKGESMLLEFQEIVEFNKFSKLVKFLQGVKIMETKILDSKYVLLVALKSTRYQRISSLS